MKVTHSCQDHYQEEKGNIVGSNKGSNYLLGLLPFIREDIQTNNWSFLGHFPKQGGRSQPYLDRLQIEMENPF